MAKYLLIAAIVISVATAILGFENHSTLVATRNTLADTSASLDTTKKNLATATANLKKSSDDLTTANASSEKSAADLAAAQSDLTKAKSDLDAATKASAAKDTTIAGLQKQIAEIPTGPNTTNTTPKEVVDQLSQQVQEQTAQISALSEKEKSESEAIADYKKKEVDRNNKVMQPGIEGRVLAVNPAWNFVVLSIGDKQGAVNNAEMLLKRGGQYLGKVRITSVEPSTSIADIVANTLPSGVAVQPGDSVIFQANE